MLDDLEASYTGIRSRIVDETGELRRFVNVYVGNDDVRFLDGLATATPDGTQDLGDPGGRRAADRPAPQATSRDRAPGAGARSGGSAPLQRVELLPARAGRMPVDVDVAAVADVLVDCFEDGCVHLCAPPTGFLAPHIVHGEADHTDEAEDPPMTRPIASAA